MKIWEDMTKHDNHGENMGTYGKMDNHRKILDNHGKTHVKRDTHGIKWGKYGKYTDNTW